MSDGAQVIQLGEAPDVADLKSLLRQNAGLIRDDRFTLLTCPPGPDIQPYHDRQIVILPPEHWAQWLDTRRPAPPIAPAPAATLTVVQIR